MLKSKIFLSVAMIASFLVMSCASTRHHASEIMNRNTDDSRAAAMSGGSEFAVVEFDKGSYALSEKGRMTLEKVAQSATAKGKDVQQIEVLAWADKEYPDTGIKAERGDVNLADDRASVIKSYLKEDLKSNADVDKHNMAQRPGSFAEFVKSDDYRIKENFENAGAAPSGDSVDKMNSKVSKAIVVIKYE